MIEQKCCLLLCSVFESAENIHSTLNLRESEVLWLPQMVLCPQKSRNIDGRKSLSVSILPEEFVHFAFFFWSSSKFLSTKKGFTWHGDYTDKKQNTKPSSISLGEITVICRQNPQVTTYNHCQVYTATFLSFFKPFSFLNTEQWCSTMQMKMFKAMGQNFGFLWHRSTAWPRHQIHIVSVQIFGEGFSKDLHSDVTLLLFKDSQTCTDFGGTQ